MLCPHGYARGWNNGIHTLRDQMGALADIKIAEMKTKDIFAKPMMKTKVSWSQLVNSMFY